MLIRVGSRQLEQEWMRWGLAGSMAGPNILIFAVGTVHLSEGSGQKQTNNQHKMTTVVSGGLPLQFWYQTSSRCIVHAFG